MYIDRRHIWALFLALVSLAAGLVLIVQGPGLGGLFIQLSALLMVYGLVVAWWHTKRAVSVLEVQTARAVHRALRGSLGRMR